MKKLTCILLFWGMFTGTFSGGHDAIEFHPRRLDREILSHFNKPEFRIREIRLNGSSGNQDVFNGKFYRVMHGDTLMGYVYVGRVNSCRKDGCSVSTSATPDVTSEFFDYFALFDHTKKVISVVVYNYEATHGQEITARGWLRQFTGYNGEKELTVGRNVDAISGATISVHGIVDDLMDKTSLLRAFTTSVNGHGW
jgi:hypothetical protein